VAPTDDQIWRSFVDQHTPTLLALIERNGVRDHDEAMDLYVFTCQRLSANQCARLKRYDPRHGAIGAWLAVVVRNATVDWVRTRAGRPRLFAAVKTLPPFDQRVFELYYWKELPLAVIAGTLAQEMKAEAGVAEVLDALGRIEAVLTPRHRRELLSLVTRTRRPASLTPADEEDDGLMSVPSPEAGPEDLLAAQQLAEAFDQALRTLPPEDGAIVRLKYVQGLSTRDVQAALHLERLTEERLRAILDKLRVALAARVGETA
jgi:DNA-directed RNA polymerase specialized sigma24 family protein